MALLRFYPSDQHSFRVVINDVYNQGPFRWCDFCLPLSRATFIARTAHVIEKILNDLLHL